MKHLAFAFVMAAAICGGSPAIAAEPLPAGGENSLQLEAKPEIQKNRFAVGYLMGFGIRASFRNLGGYVSPGLDRLTLDQDTYNYDNGYVLVDSSGNRMGYTRYWGYDSSTQVPGDGTLIMQRSSSLAITSSRNRDDDPMPGLQVSYTRELIHKKTWRLGLEAAFGYNEVNLSDNDTYTAALTRVYDVYAIPAQVVPVFPPPGYQGRKNLPGPVIEANPISTTTEVLAGATSISGERKIGASLFGFRFGPSIEVPVSHTVTLMLGGGLAVMGVDSDFSFRETVTASDLPGSQTQAGSGEHSAWLPGGYVAGSCSVALSDRWAAFAGVQWQNVGEYTHTLNGKQAVLDLSNMIFVTFGLSYSF